MPNWMQVLNKRWEAGRGLCAVPCMLHLPSACPEISSILFTCAKIGWAWLLPKQVLPPLLYCHKEGLLMPSIPSATIRGCRGVNNAGLGREKCSAKGWRSLSSSSSPAASSLLLTVGGRNAPSSATTGTGGSAAVLDLEKKCKWSGWWWLTPSSKLSTTTSAVATTFP